MINKFEEMKPNLLKRTVCEDYEIEYNHHVNVNLAIGIDFGTVLFEYLEATITIKNLPRSVIMSTWRSI